MQFPNILRAVENGPALGQAGSAAAMACAFSLRFLNLIFLAVYSPLQQTLAGRGGVGGVQTAEVTDLSSHLWDSIRNWYLTLISK